MSTRKFSAATSDRRDELFVGYDIATRRRVALSMNTRRTHLHVIGASGTGKTRGLEHMIREDILARRGVCVMDPTGNLYRRLVAWLARNPRLDRPVILFNPGEDEYVTAYNPIRRSAKDASLRVDEMVKACAKVWGAENMHSTPLLKKCLRMIFTVLAVRNLSLLEAQHLINPKAPDLRSYLSGPLSGTILGEQWDAYNTDDAATFRRFSEDFSSSMSRLIEFLSSPRIVRIFGQTEHSLDLRQLMDTGAVLLVNLSREFLSQDSARLLGTLLVNDFYVTATERPEGSRPFFLYIDECWQFINEDIGHILDECRQRGLHLILSHQHLAQLKEAGEAVYMGVRTNAQTKLIFGGLAPEDARLLAEQIYMGEFDLDEVKLKLDRTFEHHRLQWLDIVSRSRSHTNTTGGSHTDSFSSDEGVVFGDDGDDVSRSEGSSRSAADTANWTEADTEGESVTRSPFLLPEEDSETSSVQFRDIEEQLYRAMSTMVNQPTQHALLKVPGAKTREIITPTLKDLFVRSSRLRAYEIARYSSVPFCLPAASAQEVIDSRRATLLAAQRANFDAASGGAVHSTPDHEPPPTRQPRRAKGASVVLKPGARKKNPA